MISGKTLLLTGLLLPLWANASAPEDDGAARALVAALARPAPARTAFAEARFLRVLDRPLVVTGELGWLGGDQLERRVEHPHAETASIANGRVIQQREGHAPRSFSLQRAPQLQVLLDSFVALLGGDAARLLQAFAIYQEGSAKARWSLTLTPRDPTVAKAVASIRIDGDGKQPRCMRMQEADGDLAIDLLGSYAAKMPVAPTREALDALCQAGN